MTAARIDRFCTDIIDMADDMQIEIQRLQAEVDDKDKEIASLKDVIENLEYELRDARNE